MSADADTRGLSVIKVVGAAALVVAGLWAFGTLPSGPTDDDENCTRKASFTANWVSGTVRATKIKWGVHGQEVPESNVRPPWQRLNFPVPCNATVRLEVTFPAHPGEVLATITANGEVYDAKPTDGLGRRWVVSAQVHK